MCKKKVVQNVIKTDKVHKKRDKVYFVLFFYLHLKCINSQS